MSSHFSRDSGVWKCVAGGVVAGFLAGFATKLYLSKRKSEKTFRLAYFPGRGLAEITRTLFATKGVTFKDDRVGLADAPSKTSNLGRLPQLEVSFASGAPTLVIGQSLPIAMYVAEELDLLGNSEEEKARILEICQCIKDVGDAFSKVYPYGGTPKENWEKIWFEEDGEEREKRQLRWYLKRISALILRDDGYCVGGRPSLADAYIYNRLYESFEGDFIDSDYFTKERQELSRYPFRSSADRTKKLLREQFPKLNKICERFGSSPGMAAHLKNRGKQMF